MSHPKTVDASFACIWQKFGAVQRQAFDAVDFRQHGRWETITSVVIGTMLKAAPW